MNFNIKYNETDDEFMVDLTLQMRIERYITNHFYPAYTISLLSPIYLVGGGIRDLMNAKVPKDLDFVVLDRNDEWIKKVLDAYKIIFKRNKFGGFKFKYNDTVIDLWYTKDLFSAMQYNVDGLLYDLGNKAVISLTFNDFVENGIRIVNNDNNIENGREMKLLKFQKGFRK